jgi:hypothetical protein
VKNAYLNATTKKKYYTIAGPEFGPDNEGRTVLIVRALYGLRSSGVRCCDHPSETISKISFSACLADGDVWLWPNVKPGGYAYYEYVLVYVDDILAVLHDPQSIMIDLSNYYTLKAGSVRAPKEYLGSDISQYNAIRGLDESRAVHCWSMSARTYIKRAVAEVKQVLGEINQQMKTKVTTPISDKYQTELNATPKLYTERITYFQGLIGVHRWIVELGRINIMVAVAMLSSHLMSPGQGDLEQCFNIFAYLDSHRNADEARFASND